MSVVDQIIELFSLFQADLLEQVTLFLGTLLAIATGLLEQFQNFI